MLIRVEEFIGEMSRYIFLVDFIGFRRVSMFIEQSLVQ